MTTLYLYSTEACHLCELAEALVRPLLKDPFTLEIIEISDSEELIERYGVRIPVVRRVDTDEEIGWPFDEPDFQAFLRGA